MVAVSPSQPKQDRSHGHESEDHRDSKLRVDSPNNLIGYSKYAEEPGDQIEQQGYQNTSQRPGPIRPGVLAVVPTIAQRHAEPREARSAETLIPSPAAHSRSGSSLVCCSASR